MNGKLSLAAWSIGVILALSALLNAFFIFQQTMVHKDLAALNARRGGLPQPATLQSTVQNAVNDFLLYGQKQPAIYPVLNKYGVPTPAATAATPPHGP